MFGLLAWNPEAIKVEVHQWTHIFHLARFGFQALGCQVRHGQLQLLLSEGKRTWQDHLFGVTMGDL